MMSCGLSKLLFSKDYKHAAVRMKTWTPSLIQQRLWTCGRITGDLTKTLIQHYECAEEYKVNQRSVIYRSLQHDCTANQKMFSQPGHPSHYKLNYTGLLSKHNRHISKTSRCEKPLGFAAFLALRPQSVLHLDLTPYSLQCSYLKESVARKFQLVCIVIIGKRA